MHFNDAGDPQPETRCYHIADPKKEDGDEPQPCVIEGTDTS